MRISSKLFTLAALLLVLGAASACTRIGPGYVGIKVSNAGDNRGVSEIPTTTGWVFYNPFLSNVYEWPTFTQQAQLIDGDSISFQSEQMTITAPVGFSYSLEAAKVPAFFVKFRTDDLETFTHGYLKNLIRDKFNEVASRKTIEEITTDNKGFLAEVRSEVQRAVEPFGVKLEDQFGFTGSLQLPKQVVESINAKQMAIQNAQRVENELRTAQAEAAKAVAAAEGNAKARIIAAESEAEANLKVARSLTSELVEWKKLDKWNGQLPQVTSGGGGVLLSLSK